MYCPECAMQNAEGTKYCRSCGTNLETVALALKGEQPGLPKGNQDSSQDLLDRKIRAVRQIAQGGTLLAVSLLFGVVAAVAAKGDFPWFLIWAVFFGWMGCWGTVLLMLGSGQWIEAVMRLRSRYPVSELAQSSSMTTNELEGDADGVRGGSLLAMASVTEGTTKRLNESQMKGKES
ncbi:MAG TPA: zinc ribbon domain-containing protein [Blastocatellia bacterium]|nr:zinc ribbon domain-containing protein [Blastocatellia bacterium]